MSDRPDWTCPKCLQVNSGWATECGRCVPPEKQVCLECTRLRAELAQVMESIPLLSDDARRLLVEKDAEITRLRAELAMAQDRLRLAETNAGQMLAEADMAANRVKNDLSICRTRLKLAHRIIAITTEGADDSDWTDLREWRAGR